MNKEELLENLYSIASLQEKITAHIIHVIIICIYLNLESKLIDLISPFLFRLSSPDNSKKLRTNLSNEEIKAINLFKKLSEEINSDNLQIIFQSMVIAIKTNECSNLRNEVLKINPYIENNQQIRFYTDISSTGKTLQ